MIVVGCVGRRVGGAGDWAGLDLKEEKREESALGELACRREERRSERPGPDHPRPNPILTPPSQSASPPSPTIFVEGALVPGEAEEERSHFHSISTTSHPRKNLLPKEGKHGFDINKKSFFLSHIKI